MITCGAARRLAWPDGAPRAWDERVEEAEAHIRDCSDCTRFVADMRAMAHGISRSAPNPSAPRDVRERLFATLANARAEQQSRANLVRTRSLAAAAAAVAVIAAFGVWQVLTPANGDSLVAPRLVENHRQALHQEGVETADTSAVARWFVGRVPFAVHVPVFSNSELIGARVAEVNGLRGAAIRYRIDDQDVSYYILPASNGLPVTGTTAVQITSQAGYRIASWRDPGLSHALVGSLSGLRLANLARECIRQMMALMSRSG
jgi:anti-sigma factor RsiW